MEFWAETVLSRTHFVVKVDVIVATEGVDHLQNGGLVRVVTAFVKRVVA